MLATVKRLFLGGMVGKLLGVVREIIAAWMFGTGVVAAAYRLSQAAFLIPLHGFVSDAVSAGFTPNFTLAYKSDKKFANELFSSLHAVMLGVSVGVGGVLVVFAPPWVALLAPGFDAPTMRLSVTMVQILGLSMPAYALVSLYSAVDLAVSGGRITAARASVQSIGLILGTILAYLTGSPELIAVGFVLAYYYLAAWGVCVVKHAGMDLFPQRDRISGTFKRALLMIWRPFKVLIWVPIFLQVNQVIERRVASQIDIGAVAALDYAKFISETLVILLAVPFAIAGLSHMSAMKEEEFRKESARGFRVLCMLGIPIACFFHFHAEAFIELIFKRGSFDAHSVGLTSAILSAVAPGIVFQLLGYSGSRFLSGRHRNKEVLFITCLGVLVNILVNVFLGDRVGPAALGWSMTANAFVFGGLAVFRVGLGGNVLKFSMALICGALIYGVLSHIFHSQSLLITCIFSVVFWSTILTCWSEYRKELLNLIQGRAARH
jgi:putative peptidoglycan lipid II flippase